MLGCCWDRRSQRRCMRLSNPFATRAVPRGAPAAPSRLARRPFFEGFLFSNGMGFRNISANSGTFSKPFFGFGESPLLIATKHSLTFQVEECVDTASSAGAQCSARPCCYAHSRMVTKLLCTRRQVQRCVDRCVCDRTQACSRSALSLVQNQSPRLLPHMPLRCVQQPRV